MRATSSSTESRRLDPGARTSRFSTLLPISRLTDTPLTVIGCGAIGRQVSLALAAMGVQRLTLFDFDEVSPENLGPQGYRPDQIGELKVVALGKDLVAINPDLSVHCCARRFAYDDLSERERIVFCCVDSIRTRGEIFDDTYARLDLFLDARMAAECCQLYAWSPDQSPSSYRDTIFPEGEAADLPCTARSTFYCAQLASSLMVALYSKWLRGIPLPASMTVDLLGLYLESVSPAVVMA